MIRSIVRSCSFLALLAMSSASFAETVRLTTRPDGEVTFDASVNGPTRISIVGGRIADLKQTSSNFEMVNDESTGDVFLRFAGGQASRENGYIITESGHTIAFVMDPKTDLETQTVLITLRGVSNQSSRTNNAATSTAATATSSGFAVNSGGAGGSRTARLVQFARQAYANRIGNRTAGRQRVGSYRTYSAGGLTARVLVASAPGNQPPSERQFYQSSRTLAVFIDRVVSGGKVWVIVVEGS